MSAVPRLTIVLLAPVPVQIGKRHQHNEQKYRSQCHNWTILIATKMYEARNTYAADGSNLRSRPAELPRPSGLADRPGGQSVLSLLYCRSRFSTRVTNISRGSKSRTGTDTAPGSWPVRSRSPGTILRHHPADLPRCCGLAADREENQPAGLTLSGDEKLGGTLRLVIL